MNYRVFLIITIVMALFLAVIGLVPQQNSQMYAAWLTHFFVGMLPVLGVAALLKYIACCNKKSKCGSNCKGCECCKPVSSCSTEDNKGSCG